MVPEHKTDSGDTVKGESAPDSREEGNKQPNIFGFHTIDTQEHRATRARVKHSMINAHTRFQSRENDIVVSMQMESASFTVSTLIPVLQMAGLMKGEYTPANGAVTMDDIKDVLTGKIAVAIAVSGLVLGIFGIRYLQNKRNFNNLAQISKEHIRVHPPEKRQQDEAVIAVSRPDGVFEKQRLVDINIDEKPIVTDTAEQARILQEILDYGDKKEKSSLRSHFTQARLARKARAFGHYTGELVTEMITAPLYMPQILKNTAKGLKAMTLSIPNIGAIRRNSSGNNGLLYLFTNTSFAAEVIFETIHAMEAIHNIKVGNYGTATLNIAAFLMAATPTGQLGHEVNNDYNAVMLKEQESKKHKKTSKPSRTHQRRLKHALFSRLKRNAANDAAPVPSKPNQPDDPHL